MGRSRKYDETFVPGVRLCAGFPVSAGRASTRLTLGGKRLPGRADEDSFSDLRAFWGVAGSAGGGNEASNGRHSPVICGWNVQSCERLLTETPWLPILMLGESPSG
jgi:hypothetical protein